MPELLLYPDFCSGWRSWGQPGLELAQRSDSGDSQYLSRVWAADCPGVEAGGSQKGPGKDWVEAWAAWPTLGLMGSCHPSPVPGGGDPAGAGWADQRVTAVAGARAAQRHHTGVRDQVLREGLRRFPKVGG